MGIFSRPEPITVEGEIARIGIIFHTESSIVYGIHLVGHKGRFWVDEAVGARGASNDQIAMAVRGDRVRFGTKPNRPNEATGFFDNMTMKADLA